MTIELMIETIKETTILKKFLTARNLKIVDRKSVLIATNEK